MGSKYSGVVGIARAGSASAEVAPAHYLQCGTAIIDDTPVVYERDSIVSPEVLYAIGDGHNHTFSIEGIELPVGHLGYLMWLALGTQAGTTTHTLTPAAAQDYCCVQIDRGLQIGSTGSDTTQILLGAKIGSLRIEVPKQGFAKASLSGVACDVTDGSSLTATIPTGANNAPISWQSLKDGYFKIGYPLTPAADTEIQRFALEITRELDAQDGVDLGSAQPTAINEGRRRITYEIDKLFSGNAKTAYDAWLNHTEVGLDVDFTTNSNSAVLTIAKSTITGGFAKEIGASAESVMATLQGVAHRGNASSESIQWVVTDDVVVAYS